MARAPGRGVRGRPGGSPVAADGRAGAPLRPRAPRPRDALVLVGASRGAARRRAAAVSPRLAADRRPTGGAVRVARPVPALDLPRPARAGAGGGLRRRGAQRVLADP